MKRRFISARRTSDSIIEVTYRYWFRTRTVNLIISFGDFYELHTDKRFWHFNTLLYKFAIKGDKTIHINDLK